MFNATVVATAMPDKRAGKFESLHMLKTIPASPERVFEAWTDPEQLKQWWGPKDVRCVSAEVELRVGGQYRIANELPDGTVLWIGGEFEVIEKPNLLIYTWIVETENPSKERVSVRFKQHEIGTEIVLTHDLISSAVLSDQHRAGWSGCLHGLIDYLSISDFS